MNLEFHPSAAQNFNNKADSLLAEEIQEFDIRKKDRAKSFTPEFHAIVVEPIDIKEGTQFIYDDNGSLSHIILFTHEGRSVGMTLQGHEKFRKLIEGVGKTPQLSRSISEVFLKKVLCDWIKKRYVTKIEEIFTDFLLKECAKEIKPFDVWIPICQTYAEENFTIGNVIIKTLTKQMFDEWNNEVINNLSKNPEANVEGAKSVIEQKRKSLQGLAAATIKLQADKEKAAEIAYSEAETAVSCLRVFSPANFHPLLTSHCDLLGRENLKSFDYIIMESEKQFSFVSGVEPNEFQDWRIDSQQIKEIGQQGLNKLGSLVCKNNKTDFENNVVDAVLLYSKSCLKKDLSDKLLYILVPLESLLLKDENEPIMQNIAERLALLLGNSVEERREIISNVKSVYGVRSKFIHHGKQVSVNETDMIRRFMFNAWKFFILIIDNSDRFPDKSTAIETIDDIKFSGGII